MKKRYLILTAMCAAALVVMSGCSNGSSATSQQTTTKQAATEQATTQEIPEETTSPLKDTGNFTIKRERFEVKDDTLDKFISAINDKEFKNGDEYDFTSIIGDDDADNFKKLVTTAFIGTEYDKETHVMKFSCYTKTTISLEDGMVRIRTFTA